jgi:hypothetical protein
MLAPCWRFILFAQGLGFAPQLFGFSLDPLGLAPQAFDLFVGGFVLLPWRINIAPHRRKPRGLSASIFVHGGSYQWHPLQSTPSVVVNAISISSLQLGA